MNLTKETKLTLLYISIAFLFSVGMRMIWIYQFSGYEPFFFNDQFMINTNDGYYFAEGARDLISGTSTNHVAEKFYDRFHQLNDLSPVNSAVSQLTAFFTTILPFSFESIILYIPVFLSSLIVIPIILIAKNLKNLEMGFIGALLASIAWSYYNRTMVGYYDTDMLNIVLPTVLLWSIIWAIQTYENKYLLITALDILVYRWWYPQSYALEFAFFGLILFYTLVWDRKNIYNYKLLALMMFAMLNIDGFIRLPIVIFMYYIFKDEKFNKYVLYILGLSIIAFFITGGFNPIWDRLQPYVFGNNVDKLNAGLGLHFYAVLQTVREAGKIPFETFANRISGHTVTFILSFIGYVWLAYKHRIMLLALPMLGLGFLAYVGGLRFTVYAVPVLALGIAFLITEGLRYITDKKSVRILSYVIIASAILIPNIKHIESYRVPTVFKKEEVKVLDKLKTIASREDYVVTWWDYGYPIRYYSDVKTLVDGGKHSGSVNFPVSFILTKPQDISSKMARLDVEYTEKTFKFKKENLEAIKAKKIKVFSNIEQMTKDYGFDNTNDFLFSLETDIKLPKKTRDIYLYLPYRMMDIYPTVKVFSNLDLMSGQKYKHPFFYVTRNFKKQNGLIYLGNNIILNLKDSTLQIGDNKQHIRRFTATEYDNKQKLKVQEKLINFASDISVIYMKNYNTFLVMDEPTYNSTYIQLMVLEKYDKKLFEEVIFTPLVKVYKLKI
ncbi:peptide transporter [Sulfurimonas lithotrophica]|uniref:Peptide transporter n=1 Tax=Sulfurimonas lithotrophica TaxID=2590022 RepID=A0A5P8NZJ1_9BACT|nr:STT3 domain-containing protein [Sulfurimonas lithotrophica]QFR48868.1 peptide transporter [Sulfurimonas lithotrophica]